MFSLSALISLLTLTLLEIVLGIDNVIFVSIIMGRMPKAQQKRRAIIGCLVVLLFVLP
ncbi:MAG: Integral rane protein TerC family, partial [Bacteroidota bacterium]